MEIVLLHQEVSDELIRKLLDAARGMFGREQEIALQQEIAPSQQSLRRRIAEVGAGDFEIDVVVKRLELLAGACAGRPEQQQLRGIAELALALQWIGLVGFLAVHGCRRCDKKRQQCEKDVTRGYRYRTDHGMPRTLVW